MIYNELDFSNLGRNSNQQTYENTPYTPDEIIGRHSQDLKTLGYELKDDDEMRKLPNMYWTPKMHKKKVGSRFIIASKKSTLKFLAMDVTKIFQCIFSHVRVYQKLVRFYSGLNNFWVVENGKDVVATMDRLSKKSNAKSVSTFDFSTLYTQIPHDQLVIALSCIIRGTFDGSHRRYLSVTKSGANWVSGKRKTTGKIYDVEEVISALKFLVSNSYFLVGKNVFRQNPWV